MQNGTRTLFRSDEVPIHSVLCDPDVRNRQFIRAAASRMPPIMLDLLSFSRLLNKAGMGQIPKLNPLDYTETLLSLVYRLIDLAPLREASTKPGGLYGGVIYYSMLSFMTTLLPEYTRDRSSCPLLSDYLASAIQDLCTTAEPPDSSPPLVLWILFISGISVLNPKDHNWLSPLIADTCKRLDLENWASIQRQLSQFPWILALHEGPGHCLWKNI